MSAYHPYSESRRFRRLSCFLPLALALFFLAPRPLVAQLLGGRYTLDWLRTAPQRMDTLQYVDTITQGNDTTIWSWNHELTLGTDRFQFLSPTGLYLNSAIFSGYTWEDTTFHPRFFSNREFRNDIGRPGRTAVSSRLFAQIDHQGNLIRGAIEGNNPQGFFDYLDFPGYYLPPAVRLVDQLGDKQSTVSVGFMEASRGMLMWYQIPSSRLVSRLKDRRNRPSYFDRGNCGLADSSRIKGFFYLYKQDSAGNSRLLYTGNEHPLPIIVSSVVRHGNRIYCAGSILRMTYCQNAKGEWWPCQEPVSVPFGRDTLRFQTVRLTDENDFNAHADSIVQNQTNAWLGAFDLEGNPLWCVEGKTPYFSSKILGMAVLSDGSITAAAALVRGTCFGSTCIDTFPLSSLERRVVSLSDSARASIEYGRSLVGLRFDNTGRLLSADNIGPMGLLGENVVQVWDRQTQSIQYTPDWEGTSQARAFHQTVADSEGNLYVGVQWEGNLLPDSSIMFSGQRIRVPENSFYFDNKMDGISPSDYLWGYSFFLIKINRQGNFDRVIFIPCFRGRGVGTGRENYRPQNSLGSISLIEDKIVMSFLVRGWNNAWNPLAKDEQFLMVFDTSGRFVDTLTSCSVNGCHYDPEGVSTIYIFPNHTSAVDSCGHVYWSGAYTDYLIIDGDTLRRGSCETDYDSRITANIHLNTINLFHARFRKRGALWLDTLATTGPSCPGARDGSIRLRVEDGSAPYSYRWSTGSVEPELANAAAGKYLVTVTDASGCSQLLFVKLKEPDTLKWADRFGTPPDCRTFGTLTASATGGTPPYAYRWSNGDTTATADSLLPGAHALTLTDARGCSITWDTTLAGTPPLTAQLRPQNATCVDPANGSVQVEIEHGSAPFTYRWSTGSRASRIASLSAGIYGLTLTDADSCQITLETTLEAPDTLKLTLDGLSHPSCAGVADGSLTVQAAGGTPPYDYRWSDGNPSGNSASGLPGGGVQVEIRDAAGCLKRSFFSLIDPPGMALQFEARKPRSLHLSEGELRILVISGGRAPYRYLWSSGHSGSVIRDVPASEYSVTVTDADGCQAVGSYRLESETLRGDFDLRPFLPDAFSPNGDGLNDVWQVELPRWIDLAEVWLYDRWGTEVARLSGRERLTWDGTDGTGRVLPAGAYAALVRWRDVNGQAGQHRGTVTVVR